MRALRYHAALDLRVDDVPEPGPPGPTQVTVAPRWCGICGTDVHEYVAGPMVMLGGAAPVDGCAGCRRFSATSSRRRSSRSAATVTRAQVGDRVSVMPLVYCGRCDYCRRGLQHLCVSMACTGLSDAWGGIAELAVLEEYQVFGSRTR